jgi:hypothetical protein
VSLAEAGIDRVVPRGDRALQTMLHELNRDDERRSGSSQTVVALEETEEPEEEPEETALEVKVPG